MGRLSGESKSGKGIHDKVNPEHLSGGKRRLREDASTSEHNEHSDDIDSKLELEELADVVVDVTAISDSGQDRAEVIIHQLNVTSVLGNFSTSDSHSKSNIRAVKSGSIIGTITSDGNSSALFNQTVDEEELVIGLRSGHHLKLVLDLSESVLVANLSDDLWLLLLLTSQLAILILGIDQFLLDLYGSRDGFAENWALHAEVLGELWVVKVILSDDTGFERDGSSSVNVVTSDHTNVDTGLVAGLDSVSDSWSERVLQAKDTNHNQVVLGVFHVATLHLLPGVLVVLNVGNKHGAKAFAGVRLNDFVDDSVLLLIVEFHDLAVGTKVVSALEDNFLGCSLDENTHLAVDPDASGGSLSG